MKNYHQTVRAEGLDLSENEAKDVLARDPIPPATDAGQQVYLLAPQDDPISHW